MLEKNHKILVVGARGMVGSALVRCLTRKGYHQLLTPSHADLDCIDSLQVRAYLNAHRPDVVVVAAAKVGGIWANMTYPAEFLYQNLMIGSNVIHESHLAGIPRLLYLGSTCIYPKEAPQPINEEALLSGPLEKTNEAYALAKIAGVKLCQAYRAQYGRSYISAMPTNLYGPNDNYHPENSHVIPALIRRFHAAKVAQEDYVEIWGTGQAKREFLYVDDLAEAILHLLLYYDEPSPINVGSTEECTIQELAKTISEVISFKGRITNDRSKPDGTLRKKTDLTKILALGWSPQIDLKEGLRRTYADFLSFLKAI